MRDLKPCPFCGAEPVFVTESDPQPPFGLRTWIKCPQCRQAQVCSDWYRGDLGTTEAAWQKRATKRESVNQRLVDLVRVMLEEDPSDYAADAVTVLDVWRKSAAELLSAIEEQGRRG